MEIVGPLEKRSTSYEYILVICDYVTRFPATFLLRSITTPKIISALVQLFSRVVPDSPRLIPDRPRDTLHLTIDGSTPPTAGH